MIHLFMSFGVWAEMWKRDISKAFRSCPIAEEDLDVSWVTFMAHGFLWASQHFGMPFGCVSAVYAWHRVGAFMAWVVVKMFKCPLARYVDDYFGCSRQGIKYTGGYLLSAVAELLGFPAEPSKAEDGQWFMTVLGIDVNIKWAERLVTTVVNAEKARR